ncbi:MAG: mitochondrial fission ELM1 family protein [Gammaproteobacteria bacterium]
MLIGRKAGDNAQVLALAEALGWPFEVKQMQYRPYELATNLILGDSLAGLVKRSSSPMVPPWPDLVISAGRRNEPVARWIKKSAGGIVRIVHFGRPWAALKHFDLLITTPQYGLPKRPNVLHNTLPLHHITPSKLAAAAQRWAPQFAYLPRPYIAVLVGGHSGHHTFSAGKARCLARQASALAREQEGSLLVTTSARTPGPVIDEMESAGDVPAYFFRWTPNVSENPYFGYLALADAFIVTGDSMSMLTEACASNKPVYIFDIAVAGWNSSGRTSVGTQGRRQFRAKAWLSWIATKLAPRRMVRDVGVIHRQLIAAGRAVWLGQRFTNTLTIPALDDVVRATARVRQLFDNSPGFVMEKD